MTAGDDYAEFAALPHREALFLDEQRWDDWLALYAEDVEYWAPADCRIAAIACSRGMAVATRNVRDFGDIAVETVDPWTVV